LSGECQSHAAQPNEAWAGRQGRDGSAAERRVGVLLWLRQEEGVMIRPYWNPTLDAASAG
jgi:hypothetical protein